MLTNVTFSRDQVKMYFKNTMHFLKRYMKHSANSKNCSDLLYKFFEEHATFIVMNKQIGGSICEIVIVLLVLTLKRPHSKTYMFIDILWNVNYFIFIHFFITLMHPLGKIDISLLSYELYLPVCFNSCCARPSGRTVKHISQLSFF